MTTPLYKIFDENNKIYIKREDLIPFSFGGNKARKAFIFFEEIDSGDYNAVVTYGSSSSNHCRVVSNMAASRGIPTYIISPEEASAPTYNSQMMDLFGAEITVVPVALVGETIEKKINELKSRGLKPYFIPGGGHGNLGTRAYVECYEEICTFEKENNIHFDYIFFASGTGTTQAGLIVGKIANHDERNIVGISIARKNPRGRDVVLSSVREYILESKIKASEEEIQNSTIFIDSYTGDGYGKCTEEIRQTIETMLTRYGIPMDSTYTAKAYAGMQDFLKQEDITNKNILFIHTGGTPLFFDDFSEETK